MPSGFPEGKKKSQSVSDFLPSQNVAEGQFYCGTTQINSYMAGVKRNIWLCWHSPNGVLQMLNYQLNPAMQVNPEKTVPGDQIFKGQL